MPDAHFILINEEIYIAISTFIRPSIRRWQRQRSTFEFPIPAVVSQSVTNKSCFLCVKSE